MSVQGGIWNFDQKPIARQRLTRMAHQTAAYGPDGEALCVQDTVGLFFRPFFTTPESRAERQPFCSTSGNVVTWDGRLDNRESLIQQLAGKLESNCTDVAIVSEAFDKWGLNSFSKLTGDWATAVWNQRNRELLLARDYIGVRHLYYDRRADQVTWCSNLAPLVLSDKSFKLCEDYFAGYLSFWPDAHLTPYREIRSVPPGCVVQISSSRETVQRYWHPNPGTKIRYNSDAEYEEHFRDTFRQAVRRRLRTASPILADLSGGLDSSSIVCMADEIMAKEGAETPFVDTFSMSDRSEPDEEDFLYFTKVEEKRGRIGHHAELNSTGDSLSFDYPDFIPIPGFGDREEVKAIRSALVEEHGYRVRLSGLGGDEVFGNTLDPCVQGADLLRQLRLKALTKHLMRWSLLVRRPWISLFGDSLSFLLPVPIREHLQTGSSLEGWINRRFALRNKLQPRHLIAAEGRISWLPSYRDHHQTLNTLSRQLTRTLPSNCEIRYPFLDQNLVEFLMQIPTDQLLRPGQRRSLMRRSLARILPPEILSRRTKSGLGRCFILTIDKHWPILNAALRSPISAALGWIDEAEFYRAASNARRGAVSDHFFQLLNSLSAELWLRDVSNRTTILPELSRLKTSTAVIAKAGDHLQSYESSSTCCDSSVPVTIKPDSNPLAEVYSNKERR